MKSVKTIATRDTLRASHLLYHGGKFTERRQIGNQRWFIFEVDEYIVKADAELRADKVLINPLRLKNCFNQLCEIIDIDKKEIQSDYKQISPDC